MSRAAKEISVTVLKAKLLEVVREVEKGNSYSITKDGKRVGVLGPAPENMPAAVGFAPVEVTGDLLAPIHEEWTFDAENVRRGSK